MVLKSPSWCNQSHKPLKIGRKFVQSKRFLSKYSLELLWISELPAKRGINESREEKRNERFQERVQKHLEIKRKIRSKTIYRITEIKMSKEGLTKDWLNMGKRRIRWEINQSEYSKETDRQKKRSKDMEDWARQSNTFN